MAITSFIVAALATIAAASPIALNDRAVHARNGNHTTSGGVAISTIYPSTLSLWHSGSSAVTYDTTYGMVERYSPSLNEFATLFTYKIPAEYQSNTCELVFTMYHPDAHSTGTKRGQVFYNNQPARAGATSDNRDNQIATLSVVDGGLAIWGTIDGTSTGKTGYRVPCANLISKPYLEVAALGESDYIYFPKNDGLKINILA